MKTIDIPQEYYKQKKKKIQLIKAICFLSHSFIYRNTNCTNIYFIPFIVIIPFANNQFMNTTVRHYVIDAHKITTLCNGTERESENTV